MDIFELGILITLFGHAKDFKNISIFKTSHITFGKNTCPLLQTIVASE